MYKENNEHLGDKLVRIKGFQCHCEDLTPAEDQNYAALEPGNENMAWGGDV